MRNLSLKSMAAALLAALAFGSPAGADSFGYTMAYQGELKTSGVPMNGTADFVFKLFTAVTNGTQVGPTWFSTMSS